MWSGSISFRDLASLIQKSFEDGTVPIPKEFLNEGQTIRASCREENIFISKFSGITAKVFFYEGEEVKGTSDFRLALVPMGSGRMYPDFHMGYTAAVPQTEKNIEEVY